jgi:UDP-glucose:(heptosyl)LPS alpha-1,3-glucosyltransferase
MRLAINFQHVDPAKGGAETYVADLCRRLVAAGHQVHLYASTWNDESLAREVVRHRVAAAGATRRARLWSFAVNSETALRCAKYDCTVGLINTWHHDVIIPQGGVQAASLEYNSRRFAPGWRRSLYLRLRRGNPKHALVDAIERRQYDPARAARVVAVSQMVREHLWRYCGVPAERVRVIPNAIDADRLAVADRAGVRRDFRARLGLREDDLIALFAGHNFRLKGLPALLDGLSRRTGRPIHLVVCGGGRIARLRDLVRRLGLAGSVHPLGFMADVRPCFHGADFFVLPTYYDPCSLVVFEALACGLPVITTACNGAGELITGGREGYVIAGPDDLGGLVNALDAMTDDRQLREMASCALALGRAQSFDKHVGALLELFDEVAEDKRTVSSVVSR